MKRGITGRCKTTGVGGEEVPGVPLDEVVDVSNYVNALEHGLERLQGGFPLSNRLLREIHARLLAFGRGSRKEPGSFRRSQNWIAGSRPGNAPFVPVPPSHLEESMGTWNPFFMILPRTFLSWSGRPLPMSSSKRFTPSSMEMEGSVAS